MSIPVQGELFGIFWQKPDPLRLRVNDVIRIDGRLGLVIRVNDCAAVVLMNRPARVQDALRQAGPLLAVAHDVPHLDLLGGRDPQPHRRQATPGSREEDGMKEYAGRREGHAVLVTVGGRPLDPRLDLWNHSPTGFEWGYGGSGPAQLALALLADHLGEDERALDQYQRFKRTVVSNFPYASWTLTGAQINHALASLPAQPKGVPSWTCIVPPVASRGMSIISGMTPSSRRV